MRYTYQGILYGMLELHQCDTFQMHLSVDIVDGCNFHTEIQCATKCIDQCIRVHYSPCCLLRSSNSDISFSYFSFKSSDANYTNNKLFQKGNGQSKLTSITDSSKTEQFLRKALNLITLDYLEEGIRTIK